MRRLRSGATTGERCVCGADMYAYFRAHYVHGVAQEDLDWHWSFVCEAGHEQPEPEALPVQLSLLEMMASQP